MPKKNINQVGGDGYTINPAISIGGMPGHNRYSYNLVPVFEGSLLQNGGSIIKNKKEDTSVYDLIKMEGGSQVASITQFSAIKEVSSLLSPLGTSALISLILLIFMQSYTEKRPRKEIQIGGGFNEMGKILAPLGKTNLIVLASLLLLHYAAKNTIGQNVSYKIDKIDKKKMVGGGGNEEMNSSLNSILAPLGTNPVGTSLILSIVQQAFNSIDEPMKKMKIKTIQEGGSSVLKDLIAPLGTNAFIATGLLILMERLFVNNKKNNYEKLFNTLAPISFNSFAKKSFLDKMVKSSKKISDKKK